MGLFSRKKKPPIEHPVRTARIHVHADAAAVRAGCDTYARIAGRCEPTAAVLAEADGWTTVVIDAAVHPWAIHNLTLWLLGETDATVLCVVDPADGHHGYWVENDPTDNWLAGHRDDGVPITIDVPDNAWVIGDPVPVPAATRAQALDQRGVPGPLHAATEGETVSLPLEDAQHDLNPGSTATFDDRSRMARRHDGTGLIF